MDFATWWQRILDGGPIYEVSPGVEALVFWTLFAAVGIAVLLCRHKH